MWSNKSIRITVVYITGVIKSNCINIYDVLPGSEVQFADVDVVNFADCQRQTLRDIPINRRWTKLEIWLNNIIFL